VLVEQLEKGQLLVQRGTNASGGGAARAPNGTSPYRKPRADSALYSENVLRQLAELGGTAGLANAGLANADAVLETAPAASNEELDYQLCVEVAGRARCQKQKLEISAVDGGQRSGERAQSQAMRADHQNPHRSLVEFKRLPPAPRDLTLVIAASGAGGPIRLPLVSAHPTSGAAAAKKEWDTVLVPVRPLGYINRERQRQQADLLRPGFVYVFWNNQLWRELEVGKNQRLRDINVSYHRASGNNQRAADGHWLSDILVPYKLNGADQSGQLCMLYSEKQLDLAYIEVLENDPAKLQAKGSALTGIGQYSQQQSFRNSSGDMGDIETALLDQDIDPASGYQPVSARGAHLQSARDYNIPTVYLTPIGEKFVLQVQDHKGNPYANKHFSLEHPGGTLSGQTDARGILEVILEEPISTASITLSLNGDQPSHEVPFKTEGDSLPVVSTVKGQQLRLNNLGYNAGAVDGLMGRKTRGAAMEFQKDHELDVDGIIGPKTQSRLQQVYGQ